MRYVKLYFAYAKASLMSKLVYKSSVIIGILAFLFGQATSLYVLLALVGSVPSIDGWGIYEVGMLFGMTNMAIGIDHLFTDRLWTVAYYEVRMGRLDHMFLRPLPVLLQVIASEIQLEAFGEIIIAVAMMALCFSRISVTLLALDVLLIAVGIICASVIISSFKIAVASLSFKFNRSGPLLQFIYNFSGYTKYPLKIYPRVIQSILTFVIPLGLCLFFPFENMLTRSYSPTALLVSMLSATAVFATLSVIIWSRMIHSYESTGT